MARDELDSGRDDLPAGLDDLDLDAAIGAAESLVGTGGAQGVDLDAVLNADSDAEALNDGPRRYDFNRPHNISRAFEHNLQAVAESMAKTASIEFTSLLRTNVQVEYKGLRQCNYGEYLAELPNPTCACQVTLPPLKGYSLLHLDLNLSFVFMKKLMGGVPEADATLREFTEIERAIQAGIVERHLDIIRRATAKLVKVEPGFVGLENNPNYLSGINEGESLVIVKFLFKLDTLEGPMELAVPLPAFGPVREVFDPRDSLELRTSRELQEDRRKILSMVRGTTSELVVQLGVIDSSLDRVLKLAVGDLLHLPQTVDAPLKVQLAGQNAWLAEAGRVGRNRAVKLIEQLNKE